MAQAFNLTAQLNLRGPSNIKNIVSDIKRQIGTVQGTVNFTIDPRTTRNVGQLESALRTLNSAFVQTQNNATAAANAIRVFNNSMSNVSSAANNINRSLQGASTATQTLGRQTQTTAAQTKVAISEMEEFGKQSALAVRRFAAFSSVTTIIFAFTNALSKGLGAFIEFDKEFVKLQQVTDTSASQLKGLANEITNLSKNFGVASSDLINVASTLAQAGLSAKDTERALRALALTDLAPSFDSMNETVEGSIALMRQFGIGANDLEKSLGSVNAVAAAFAVEASDIITAIQRTGGVFASASKGVSQGTDALNEFIAIFTSVRQTTRESAETIATGLRTIFTRIQRESTIEALREFGVVLTDLEGKFVGPYEAVRKLSEGLSRLDPRDLKFSQIIEELGGFRQIGKVIPLIQQFAVAQDALAVAQSGQGSLAQDAIKAQLSLANQMSKVREEFLALMRDIGNSDTFQAIAKSALGFASTLIKIADGIKGILPILAVIGLGKAASGISQFATGFIGGIKKGPDGQAGGGGSGAGGGGQGGGSILSRVFGGGGGAPQNIGVRELTLLTDALRSNTSSLSANTTSINNLSTLINNLISSINNRNSSRTLASGGIVKQFARGGVVPGTGSGDTVPAMLEPGEFVIRKKAVETIGADNLHNMNKYGSGGSIRSRRTAKRKKFASGGKVFVDYPDESIVTDTIDSSLATAINSVGNQLSPTNKNIKGSTAKKMPNYAGVVGSIFEAGLSRATEQEFGDDKKAFDFPSGINVKTYSKLNGITSDAKRNFNIKDEYYKNNIYNKIGNALKDKINSSNQNFGVAVMNRGNDGEFDWTPELVANAQIQRQRKNLGGKIQKFLLGGTVEETASLENMSLKDAAIAWIKELGGIVGVKQTSDIPRGDRTLSKVLRADKITSGTPEQLQAAVAAINKALQNQKAKKVREAQSINKMMKLGIVGLEPLGYSKDEPFDTGFGKAALLIRGLPNDPMYANLIEQTRQGVGQLSTNLATGLQTATAFGGNQPIALDFDETLVKGADIFGPDGKPDIPAYDDLNKVKEALKNGQPTELAQKLKSILDFDPSFIDRIRILTARPQENANLLAEKLNSIGLPILASKIQGTRGGGATKATALGVSEKLIDDNYENVLAAIRQGKTAKQYAELRDISEAESRASGIANAEGAILQIALAKLGAQGGTIKEAALDFENGLGLQASQVFGLPPDIPTEVKRTLSSAAIGRAEDEFRRYFSETYGPFSKGSDVYSISKTTGLPISRFAEGGEVVTRGTVRYLKSDIEKAMQGIGLSYDDFFKRIPTPNSSFDQFMVGASGPEGIEFPRDLRPYNPKSKVQLEMEKAAAAKNARIQAALEKRGQSMREYEPRAKFALGGTVKLYHGSNTGTDDSVLKSFKEKGALSNIAQGYGQGAGFYLYTEKDKAIQQAKMRVGGGSGFTVTSGDTSGKPMVLSFEEILDPKTYDLDYELQKNLVTQWLHDNFDKIKDKAAPDKEKGLAGIRGIIAKDTSKGIMSAGIKTQSAEGTIKPIYAGGDSSIREGEILGQIMNRLQSGDPELINAFESELFKRPLGLALKYVGASPLKPSNIETFAAGGGISGQDTVPALLTPGEFVINKKAAQNIGYSRLEKLNQADKLQGYNRGGYVGIQKFSEGGKGIGLTTTSIDAEERDLIIAIEALTSQLQQEESRIKQTSAPATSEKAVAEAVSQLRARFGTIDASKAEEVFRPVTSGQDLLDKYRSLNKGYTPDNVNPEFLRSMTPEDAEKLNRREIVANKGKATDFARGMYFDARATGRSISGVSPNMSEEEIDTKISEYRAEFEKLKSIISGTVPVKIDTSKLDELKTKIAEAESALKEIRSKQASPSSPSTFGPPSYANGVSQQAADRAREIKSEVQARYSESYNSAASDQKAGIKLQAQSEYETQATRAILDSINLTKQQRDQINQIQSDTIQKYNEEYKNASTAAEKATVKAKAQIEYAQESRKSVFGTEKPGVVTTGASSNTPKDNAKNTAGAKDCCDCCCEDTGSAPSGSTSSTQRNRSNKKADVGEMLKTARGQSLEKEFNRLISIQNNVSQSVRNKVAKPLNDLASQLNSDDYAGAAKTMAQIRQEMGGIAKLPPVNADELRIDASTINSIEDAVSVYNEMNDVIERLRANGQDTTQAVEGFIAEFEELERVLNSAASEADQVAAARSAARSGSIASGGIGRERNNTENINRMLNTAGLLVGILGQAGANLFDDKSKSGAIGKAVVGGASQTLGTGLALAGQINDPRIKAVVLLGTAAATVAGAFKDAHNAAREFEKTLSSRRMQNAMDQISIAFEDFEKNIKNINLLDTIESELSIAGSNIQTGQNIENNVPKAFWFNMLDALGNMGGSGQKAAADRSKILENEGTLGYIRSLGDDTFRQNMMDKYAPEKVLDQAKAFKPVAEQTLRLFEAKLKTGTSIEDVMKELKDATGAPTQLARNIALANPTIQTMIHNIESNNSLSAETKQSTIDEIIAREANKKSMQDMDRTLKEIEINKLNKATNMFAYSLERLFKQMEASIGRASFELENMTISSEAFNSALSGSAKASEVNLKSINVINNARAYSGAERNAAANQAGSFFGTASGDIEALLKIGDQLESNLLSAINKAIQNNPAASEESIASKIRIAATTTAQSSGMSADLSEKIGKQIQIAISDIRKEGDKGNIGIDELSERIPALGKALDSARRAQELANKALEYWQKNLNEYANAMNQSMEMQLEASARMRRASDIQIKGAMDLQKALGKEITLREEVSSVLDATSRQTGGATAPSEIGANILRLNDRRTIQQGMSDTAANRGPSGKNEFIDMQQRLRNTNMALRENYDALKNMAENTDIASAALAKINQVQQKRQAGVNMAERLVTSSPEELSKLNSAMARLSNNMAGIQNRGTTAEQRRESLDAFNMIAPMLGPDQGALKANVLESMLGESGVGVSPMMQEVLDSLRNPEEDPMMREAIETYKMGINLQSDANAELSRLSQIMADNTAEVAAEKIAHSLSKVELSFNEQVFDDIRRGIRRLVELQEGQKDTAQNAQAKAKGGVIYAAAGQMIDFSPRGTDTVPAMLTPGEFVVNKASTQKHLPLLQKINSSKYSSGGKVRYYQDGGYIGLIDSLADLRGSDKDGSEKAEKSMEEDKETIQKYPILDEYLKIEPISISTMKGGALIAGAKSNNENLTDVFKNKNTEPQSISALQSEQSILYGSGPGGIEYIGPTIDDDAVRRARAVAAASGGGGPASIGASIADVHGRVKTIGNIGNGPTLSELGNIRIYDRNLPTKNIKKDGIQEYIDKLKKVIEDPKLPNQQALDEVKSLQNIVKGSSVRAKLEFTDTGATLTNMSKSLDESTNLGLFGSGDLSAITVRNPPILGFKTQRGGYAKVASGLSNITMPSDLSSHYASNQVYSTELSSLGVFDKFYDDTQQSLAVIKELRRAYESIRTGLKFAESDESIGNKKYIRDLEELYYGTKFSATFGNKEILEVPEERYGAAQYPVTVFSPAIESKWNDIKKNITNGVSGWIQLGKFDKDGKEPQETKFFRYLDSLAYENDTIRGLISGAQAAFVADEKSLNIVDLGSNTVDNGRYMFTYQKLKARFFNDTARRFMGAGEELKEFIVVQNQSDKSASLNPFVDLTTDQFVYAQTIEELLSALDAGTPGPGDSRAEPGQKPEQVEPYKYNFSLLTKAKNNADSAVELEKSWSFLSNGTENSPLLTDLQDWPAKSYTKAREEALTKGQLIKDQADVKKIFDPSDREKQRKPEETDEQYKERMKQRKLEAKAEAWTEAKRVTLARKVYATANSEGIGFAAPLPVDIPGVGSVAVGIGQSIKNMPTDSPQRAYLDAWRAFFAELYNNGEKAKSAKEAAEGSDSGPFLKSLGIDVNDSAFGPPGPMMRVPGSTTETQLAYYGDTTNNAEKIKAVINRQFMSSRSKEFAGALSEDKKAELALDGAKIYSVNPDGTKTLKQQEEIIPQSYADIFDMALMPENIFPDAKIRQSYIDQLISYYQTAADAKGQALFPSSMSAPYVDALNTLKTWYAAQDAALNTSIDPSNLTLLSQSLQSSPTEEATKKLAEQQIDIKTIKDTVDGNREKAQKANQFLTANKYGELPDLQRLLALINVQASEKVDEMKNKAIQALNRGGVVYASTGKLINYQPRGTDTVPAMLTPGEFVVNRSATQKHLPVLEAINSGNYSRGDIVKHLSSGGFVPGYYQIGGPANAGLTGFDFGAFMREMVSQISSGITEAIKEGFKQAAQSNNSSSGVSSNSQANFNGINDFTSRLERVSNTLASLDIPREITITGKHDVNVVINGDEALNKLSPNIKDMIMSEVKKGFDKLVALNQPVPSDSLKNPYR